MPIYEYRCTTCECRFELMRAFQQADGPAPCPDCASLSKRQISAFAAFAKGPGGTSKAVAGGRSCGSCSSGSCTGGGCSGGGCASCR